MKYTTLFKLPEYYLLILIILAGYSPPFYFHPFYAVLCIIICGQLYLKNKIFGLILGGLFFMINLYFLAALLSEFYEFTDFDASAQKLLFVGLSIWILNIVASSTMIYKYGKSNIVTNSNNKIRQTG